MSKQNELKCPHIWVNRTDGDEEECTPAICVLCGKYGCICKLKLYDYSNAIKVRIKNFFYDNKMLGANHDLERSIKNETK